MNQTTLEQIRKSWNESLIYPIYKNGEKTKCDRFRPIGLIDVINQTVTVPIRNRLEKGVGPSSAEYQCGLKKIRSVVDQTFSIKQNQDNGLDLYRIMEKLKIPSKIIRMVRRESIGQKQSTTKVESK